MSPEEYDDIAADVLYHIEQFLLEEDKANGNQSTPARKRPTGKSDVITKVDGYVPKKQRP